MKIKNGCSDGLPITITSWFKPKIRAVTIPAIDDKNADSYGFRPSLNASVIIVVKNRIVNLFS